MEEVLWYLGTLYESLWLRASVTAASLRGTIFRGECAERSPRFQDLWSDRQAGWIGRTVTHISILTYEFWLARMYVYMNQRRLLNIVLSLVAHGEFDEALECTVTRAPADGFIAPQPDRARGHAFSSAFVF